MSDSKHLHLRFLTLNLFGVPFIAGTRTRIETVGHELNMSRLDVLCFQEVQLARYVPLLRGALDRFPHAAYEPFVYAPKGGLLTLSRWPLERVEFALYKDRGHWHTPALADWMLHKGMLLTYLDVQGVPVTVVNTHLVANYSGDWSRRNHYAKHEHSELRQLARAINELDPHRLTLVMGDFNVPRGNWMMAEFLAETNLHDPLADSDEPTYRPKRPLPARLALAIDYVLVRPPRRCPVEATAKVVFSEKIRLASGKLGYLSDHCAIQTLVTVPAKDTE